VSIGNGKSGRPAARMVYVAMAIRAGHDTGVQTHVETFSRYARRAGVAVDVVTPFDGSPFALYPFYGIGRLAKPFSQRAWLAWHLYSHHLVLRRRLARVLPKTEPSIVYAQQLLAAHAALDLRERGYPIEVVMTVHFNRSEILEWIARGVITEGDRVHRWLSQVERRVMRDVDRVTFPSRFVLESSRRQGPGDRQIPNFVFEPPPPSALASGDLITIGTLEPRKNHEYLLDVLACAHRLGHPYRLTIVGTGELTRMLRDRASALGIGQSVTFMGHVPRAASLLRAHRVYVHTASLENCPIVLLEAMATGIPICAGSVGGIPDMFGDGVEGVFWPLDDPQAAAERLIGVLENSDTYARMARASRRRYETTFAAEVVGPRLLESVLGERGWDSCATAS